MNESLIQSFLQFAGNCPAKRLSRNLRSLILIYVTFYKQPVGEIDLEDLSQDLDFLFRLLDAIEDEQANVKS